MTRTRPIWDAWYSSSRWKKTARAQLRKEPLCRMCAEEGRQIAATCVDHVTPHRGDQKLFWFGPLQSLCSRHHSGSKAWAEKRGFDRRIGADGYPVDPRHPVYGNKSS